MGDVQAAKKFVTTWSGRGDEKQETQSFWIELLRTVFDIENPEQYIQFEKPVLVDDLKTGKKTTKFIDGYIPATRVLIEQKGVDIDLDRGYKQSDGSLLSPFQQARRYGGYLGKEEQPDWIIVCNFRQFYVYDMKRPNDPPEVILLEDLEKDSYRLSFLVSRKNIHTTHEEEISKAAGDLVGVIYDAFRKQYIHPDDPETLRSLNKLCVRLVFCLFAEDSGLFERRLMFHDYMARFAVRDMRKALIELFAVLNTDYDNRDPYMDEDLAAFPYVNGGLFTGDPIEIPQFTDEIRKVLLEDASAGFDWSGINPTIFGAVFESTLNQETRKEGGMHYTARENIHKVIDPLFLDDLKAELEEAKNTPVAGGARMRRLRAFQDKLASLSFMDCSAGSGNFLTESYMSLRRLENEVIQYLTGAVEGQMMLDSMDNEAIGVKVSISQFYGIEINDFAVAVAQTAMWIAEAQMLQETKGSSHISQDFLPLKTKANIVEGNALRMDWNDVIPKERLSYLLGNPPFRGYSLQTEEQKKDILSLYVDENGKPYKTAGKIDYVSGWYWKAAEMMQGTKIRTALVSTNSITQGEQVAGVWKPLYERFGVHIDFAHRTFRWDSEANIKAHVHCVIVGFSCAENKKKKPLFSDERVHFADNINPYLIDAPNIFVESRKKPLYNVPEMTTGNRPADGGHLIIEADEYDEFLRKEPKAEKYIKKLIGSAEFINGKDRYCLWLVGANPVEISKLPEVMKRVNACKEDRENAPDEGRRKLALRPTQFREINNPDTYIVIPAVSSERRRYVPIGFLGSDTIATNLVITIPDATIFHFGVLTSNVHMAWMRAVCGRLKSDYRYSKDIVYNNFPWPEVSEDQQRKIEKTAQSILSARALYPGASLAELYGEHMYLYSDLVTAHQADRAVMQAYGMPVKETDEAACVAWLMRLYQEKAGGQG